MSALVSNEFDNVFTRLCLPTASKEEWILSDQFTWTGFSQRLHLSVENHLDELEGMKQHAIQQWHWGLEQ